MTIPNVGNVGKVLVSDATTLKNRYPTVFITSEAKQKLDLYIKGANGEISGLGKVIRIGNDFLIEGVYLLEQECTSASTDLDPEGVSNFLLGWIKDKRDPSELKLWWHSHDNMPAFWSSTDEATAGGFGNGWMLSIVGNKRKEYRVRLDLYDPIRLTLDGLNFQILLLENELLQNEIEAEIRAKVRTRQPLIRRVQSSFSNAQKNGAGKGAGRHVPGDPLFDEDEYFATMQSLHSNRDGSSPNKVFCDEYVVGGCDNGDE